MKIVLTGASGTLSSSLISMLNKFDIELIKIDINSFDNSIIKCDVSSFPQIENVIQNNKPDYIFHFAAETDVDYCEKNTLYALLNNFITTKNLVDISSLTGVPLLFISSASIFDGESDIPYRENDPPNPTNFYAQTKLWAEQYIQNRLKDYIIIRIGWLIGNPIVDKKFIGNIFNFIRNKNTKLFGVSDLRGTLTFADDLISLIFTLIKKDQSGIFHYGSKGSASRYEIIKKIIELLKFEDDFEIVPVSYSYFPTNAKRPKNEILENANLKKIDLDDSISWKELISIYVDKYFTPFLWK